MRIALRASLVIMLGALPADAQPSIAGDWAVTLYEAFGPNVMRLSLSVNGQTVSGSASGRPIEGSFTGGTLTFKVRNASATGTLDGTGLKGELVFPDRTVKWTAVRIPPPPASPRTHDFEPSAFALYFSSKVDAPLHIHPGDTVRTWSVDAGGVDRNATRRSPGGNPQTGPFYVEGAMPNDTLVVRLSRVRLNRGWAQSGSRLVGRALEPGALGGIKWDDNFASRWTLDTARGVATLEKPTAPLGKLTIPLQPMLGCIGVAPPGESSIRTTDSGSFGGNMDYNQLREGTTVYLPVYHPGALLFVGDGHAAQGDGELTGDALETSMDIEFTVDLIRDRSFGHPLAENAEFLISIGIAGSIDQALQQATSGMMRWLERDYKLTGSDAAMVMGFALKYDVVDLVGTQVSVAAKVPRAALAPLKAN
ncbi:MAG TPA: acetamidase/formamidase family protein [Vicinamibacterales bacterium]|jgi:acetamidase/formamidase|nr:acetamidase/formamidase family protein [Vicinamibacterales bacterium]